MLLEALRGVIGRNAEPERCAERYLTDIALEQRLVDAGFFALAENGYSALDAMLVAIVLCRLPACIEAAATLLVAPLLPAEMPRPLALVRAAVADVPGRPLRFLPIASTLVICDGGQVWGLRLRSADVRSCQTHYAYPYGTLAREELERAERLNVDPNELLRCERLALAAQMTGATEAALERTVRQVKERRQFGRAIGSFQAVQHRLAMGAAALEASRWLALRAAATATADDAALAAAQAQGMAPQLTFDLHQFSGAMGLTLEYPLHLWTYRMRALQGELSGVQAQSAAAAELAWAQTAVP